MANERATGVVPCKRLDKTISLPSFKAVRISKGQLDKRSGERDLLCGARAGHIVRRNITSPQQTDRCLGVYNVVLGVIKRDHP